MTLTNRFTPTDDITAIAGAIQADGYAIVESLIDNTTLQQLNDELKGHVEATPLGDEDFWGHKTKRFGALLQKSSVARDLLVHPLVIALADNVLLPWCASYWANYSGIMHLAPGESAQSLHRDTNLWPFANPSPPLTLATMWAVNDFTEANGGTLVVPGSHTWDDNRKPRRNEVIATQMPAGSVLLYTGNLIHGGGANQSDGMRFGLALHYVLGWLRQEETQILTMSADEARQMPRAVQKLMGYSLGAASLGMVDHKDPLEVLTGVNEQRAKALSTPELDAGEERMHRLKVSVADARGRTRIEIDDL